MIAYLSAALVLIGAAIHVAALVSARRLIALIPAGSLRNKWFAMTGLIIAFIVGYLGYVVVLWDRQAEWRDLPIPGIFVFGAIFVWLTTSLSMQTAVDLLRIDGKDKLIQAADKALYRAKQEGRNRVIIATVEDMGTAAAGASISGLA